MLSPDTLDSRIESSGVGPWANRTAIQANSPGTCSRRRRLQVGMPERSYMRPVVRSIAVCLHPMRSAPVERSTRFASSAPWLRPNDVVVGPGLVGLGPSASVWKATVNWPEVVLSRPLLLLAGPPPKTVSISKSFSGAGLNTAVRWRFHAADCYEIGAIPLIEQEGSIRQRPLLLVQSRFPDLGLCQAARRDKGLRDPVFGGVEKKLWEASRTNGIFGVHISRRGNVSTGSSRAL